VAEESKGKKASPQFVVETYNALPEPERNLTNVNKRLAELGYGPVVKSSLYRWTHKLNLLLQRVPPEKRIPTAIAREAAPFVVSHEMAVQAAPGPDRHPARSRRGAGSAGSHRCQGHRALIASRMRIGRVADGDLEQGRGHRRAAAGDRARERRRSPRTARPSPARRLRRRTRPRMRSVRSQRSPTPCTASWRRAR
jgi:hypothetical protein